MSRPRQTSRGNKAKQSGAISKQFFSGKEGGGQTIAGEIKKAFNIFFLSYGREREGRGFFQDAGGQPDEADQGAMDSAEPGVLTPYWLWAFFCV